MDEHGNRESAGPAARRRLNPRTARDWPIIALSAAGVCFIVLGLLAFALPSSLEGELVLVLGPNHALRLMDLVGVFFAAIGVTLTWLGGMLWQRQVRG